jgi:hypothetical protein
LLYNASDNKMTCKYLRFFLIKKKIAICTFVNIIDSINH